MIPKSIKEKRSPNTRRPETNNLMFYLPLIQLLCTLIQPYSSALTASLFCAQFMYSAALSIRPISSLQFQLSRFKLFTSAAVIRTMSKRNRNIEATSTASEELDNNTAKQYFLLKSEPSDYSISDLERDREEEWDGIRNYQARNYLRTMKVGDRAFFYHSKASTPALTGIVGTCRIAREAQPDMTALDPNSEYYDVKCTQQECKWDSVLVEHEQTFPVVLSLKEIKEIASKEPEGVIARLALLKQSRLSVVPLDLEQWNEVIRLINDKAASESKAPKEDEIEFSSKRSKK